MQQYFENKSAPDMSGHDRTAPDLSDYTLTIEEVAELFAEAGVPRNPRSIRRFCHNGELDCTTIETPTSARYLVSKTSAEKLIKQKQQVLRISESRSSPALSGYDRSEPDVSGHDRSAPSEPQSPHDAQEPAEHTTATKRLEDEIANLRIDNRAKEQVITMLRDERREMLAQIESANYRLGAAESRLAQIEPPKAPEIAGEQKPIEAIIMPAPGHAEPQEVQVQAEPQPGPRGSFFGRLFG